MDLTQEERYRVLNNLTKEELVGIIIENGCYISDEWLESLSSINIPFQEFWEKYAYKKGDKLGTEKKWNKLANKEREDAMKALDIYLKERDPRYIAMPQTWINQKRWIAILEAEADKQKSKEQKQEQKQKQNPFNPLDYQLGRGLYH